MIKLGEFAEFDQFLTEVPIMAFKNTLIKCLIWLGFLFVSSAITTGLAYAGVLLGAIPTILLFAAACYAARSCCKAYNRKHAPSPRATDAGEEPKPASPADGAAAEDPAEQQETREESKMGEIVQLPNAKSTPPEHPARENKHRRISPKPVIVTLSALVVALTTACCLLGYHLQCTQKSLSVANRSIIEASSYLRTADERLDRYVDYIEEYAPRKYVSFVDRFSYSRTFESYQRSHPIPDPDPYPWNK